MIGLFIKRRKGKGPFKGKSWDAIRKEYLSGIMLGWDLQPMIDLIDYVYQNGLDKILSAITFDDTLVISSKDSIKPYDTALHILYDSWGKNWHFVYYGSNSSLWFINPKPQFDKKFATGEGLAVFESFIEKMQWNKK